MKRIFDLLLTLIILFFLSLPIILLGALVWINLGRPIIFSQVRIGWKGESFLLHKFRTMSEKFDLNGDLLPDHKRMTSFGKFLRSTSLDELPEFWNILVGDMSIVGPRPLLLEYLPLYTKEQARRHEMRPGLTGWAQVNGRNLISWKEKFKLDVWYVDNWTFFLDLRIILRTISVIIKRKGINHDDNLTMTKFRGDN